MDLQLKNKVAVITGPAKGMCAAVSLAFADEGCALVLAGRDTAAIEPVAEAARAKGVSALIVRCDMTDPAQTEALAQHALRHFGRIDILVNVAGGSGPARRPPMPGARSSSRRLRRPEAGRTAHTRRSDDAAVRPSPPAHGRRALRSGARPPTRH